MNQSYIPLPPQPFCNDDLALFQIIKRLLNLLDEHFKKTNNNKGYNCHVFARAFARMFNESLQVVDGYYIEPELKVEKLPNKSGLNVTLDGGLIYDHSWLKTKNGSIMDIYPMGLFTSSPLMYRNNDSYFFESPDFEIPSETEELVDELLEILEIVFVQII